MRPFVRRKRRGGFWRLILATGKINRQVKAALDGGTLGQVFLGDVRLSGSRNRVITTGAIRPDGTAGRRWKVPPAPGNIIENMVSAITQGTRSAVPGEEGRKSVEVFMAVYESAKTGQLVALDQR